MSVHRYVGVMEMNIDKCGTYRCLYIYIIFRLVSAKIVSKYILFLFKT